MLSSVYVDGAVASKGTVLDLPEGTAMALIGAQRAEITDDELTPNPEPESIAESESTPETLSES